MSNERRYPEKAVVLRLVNWLNRMGYSNDQIQVKPQYGLLNPLNGKRDQLVDVAVFRDAERSDANLLLICECKKDTVQNDGLDQLHRYLRLAGARMGLWTNGVDLTYVIHTPQVFEEPLEQPYLTTDADFGRFLRGLRETLQHTEGADYTQRQVAKRAGISSAYLNRLEQGKASPPADKIMDALARELREDPSVVYAKAGRIPKGMRDALLARPAIGEVISSLENASDDTLLRVINRVREVKDGKW